MKKNTIIFLLFNFASFCGYSQGSWTQKANFGGIGRQGAAGFSIGTKGYIGTGWDGTVPLDDFWEWDQATDVWTQKANFSGGARYAAEGFSIGTKGYILGGFDCYDDLWEWDQTGNAWLQKASFPGGRHYPGVFSIGAKGYIGTAHCGATSVVYTDFWEWDQATDTWAAKLSFPGAGREGLVGFAIGTKGYFGTGSAGPYYNDFWEWDQTTDTWTQKAAFPGGGRAFAVGFSIGTKGYIGTGLSGGTYFQDFWEWDSGNNSWLAKADFGGTARMDATGFAIGCKGYIGTGLDINGTTQDFWEFNPVSVDLSSQNVLCNGQCSGEIIANPSGGTGPYTYLWSNTQNTQTVSGLCIGNYTLSVTDSIGCSNSDSINISEPLPLVVNLMSESDVSCYGENDGAATVSVSGGTPGYSYLWNTIPSQSVPLVSNLVAGNYLVTVIDTNGCSDTLPVVINQPDSISISFIQTSVFCNGGNTGSAIANVSGGVVPYSYSWSSGNTIATADSLTAGSYTLTVTDSSSCIRTGTVIITEPDMLISNITSDTLNCFGDNNGTLMADVSGGTLPYAYSWSSGGTAATENNLSAGTYSLTVTDSNSCEIIDSVDVLSPDTLQINFTSTVDVTCNGANDGSITADANGGVGPYSYVWSSGSTDSIAANLSAETYTVTVSDNNSCISVDSITIQQPLPISVVVNAFQAICSSNTGMASLTANGGTAPYSYLWSSGGTTTIEDGLISGSYSVTVTDFYGCTDTSSVIISAINPLSLSVSSTPTACDTSTGTATAIPSNGTQPYLYSWSTNPAQDSSTAFGLAAGNYTVTVTDSNGCTQSEPVSIAPLSGPTAALAVSATNITLGSSAQLVAVGGTTYAWTPLEGLSCADCQNPVATPVETTTYCVTVSDTSNCNDSACITITVEIPCGKIEVPTAFSPNNDGHNDLFVLQGLGNCVESFSFMIFDRWGEKVFETKNSSTVWDGTYKGKPMNPAVFVYYVNATLVSGEHVIKKGNISLIR